MRIKDLIELLKSFDQEAFIYLNIEPNIEDEFIVAAADTDNILIVPKYMVEKLSTGQEFSFYIDQE